MAQNEPLKAQNEPHKNELPSQVAKTGTAVTIVDSLVILSGLTLAATQLQVIFSPVQVPAAIAIAVFLIVAGFLASGGFAAFAICWIHSYAGGKQSIGALQLETVSKQIPITW